MTPACVRDLLGEALLLYEHAAWQDRRGCSMAKRRLTRNVSTLTTINEGGRVMYKIAASVLFVALTTCIGVTGAWADDPMSQKEAKPDLKERLMKDAVKGTLMQINGEQYVIKDDDGKERDFTREARLPPARQDGIGRLHEHVQEQSIHRHLLHG